MRVSDIFAIGCLFFITLGMTLFYAHKVIENRKIQPTYKYAFQCCIPGQKLCIDGTTKEKIQDIKISFGGVDSLMSCKEVK